jgi:hypothetical protein
MIWGKEYLKSLPGKQNVVFEEGNQVSLLEHLELGRDHHVSSYRSDSNQNWFLGIILWRRHVTFSSKDLSILSFLCLFCGFYVYLQI